MCKQELSQFLSPVPAFIRLQACANSRLVAVRSERVLNSIFVPDEFREIHK